MTTSRLEPYTPSNWLYLMGLVYFPLLYAFVYSLLKGLLPSRLSTPYIVTLSMRLVGSLQSLAACISGVYIVSRCRGDIMRDTCWLTNAFAKFCTCYFLIDLYVMYLSYVELNRLEGTALKKDDFRESKAVVESPWRRDVKAFLRRNKLMAFHHLVLPLVFGPCVVLRDGVGDFFVGALYLVEASNPFVNLRAVLRMLDYHKTMLYVVNGIVMMAVFFMCRIAIFPFLYSAYAKFEGISFMAVPAAIPFKCNLGCLVLMSMQVYWFMLMIKGLIKILRSK